MDERPRDALLVAHHCRLQLAASGPRAAVPEEIRDGAAGGDGPQEYATPRACGDGDEGGGGRRRCCGEHGKRQRFEEEEVSTGGRLGH